MKKFVYFLMAATVMLTATCKKEEKKSNISVEEITLNESELMVEKGTKTILASTIAPIDATNKGVTWVSSNPEVAIVEGGLIKALNVGTTTITVTTDDGGYVATCEVTVVIHAVGIELNEVKLTLEADQTAALVATVLPADASNQAVTWSSDNESVATVSANGLVTGISPGQAIITVISDDGTKKAICIVTVFAKTIPVTGVTLSDATATLAVGGTKTLTATVQPANASTQTVTWSSSNDAVATVSSAGLVTAKAAGSATITVTTVDGGKTATCAVTVNAVVINLGPNLLLNPNLEDDSSGSTTGNENLSNGLVHNWTLVPRAWYTSFFATNATLFPSGSVNESRQAIDVMRIKKSLGFAANAGCYFNTYIEGNYAIRLGGPEMGGGAYQIVSGVTPGTYTISVLVGLRRTDPRQNFRFDGYAMVKILSEDGATLYGTLSIVVPPIPATMPAAPAYPTLIDGGVFYTETCGGYATNPSTCYITRLKGNVTLPATVPATVRFQVDNVSMQPPGITAYGDAPASIIDDCYFQKVL